MCVRSFFGGVFSRRTRWRASCMPRASKLVEMFSQIRTGSPSPECDPKLLPIKWHRQSVPNSSSERGGKKTKKTTYGRLLSIFFLFPPEVFQLRIMPPKSSQRVLFQMKCLRRENRISHSLSLFLFTDPGVFIFFNYFYFSCHSSFEWADIDANTMCLFISPKWVMEDFASPRK